MSRFTPKEITIAIAAFIWAGLLIYSFYNVEDWVNGVIVNLVTDIGLAVLVVLFVDHANEREREQRNKARQRAIAHAIRRYYQTCSGLLTHCLEDGIDSLGSRQLPSTEEVGRRAENLHHPLSNIRSFADDAIPFAAYFFTFYTGNVQANIYPPRPTRNYLVDLANELQHRYLEIFHLDNGFLPDELVDSLTVLKDLPMFAYFRVGHITNARFGYWPQDEIQTAISHLSILQRYVASRLGNQEVPHDSFIRDTIQNKIPVEAARVVTE